ncbi:MAG: helix-turn-helix domain-containing protein [Candidatus Omnitrophota bacterium]
MGTLGERGDIFTLDGICKYLKVSRHTIYKYTQNKKMPSFKVGKELRFRKSSIDEWINKQENKRIG